MNTVAETFIVPNGNAPASNTVSVYTGSLQNRHIEALYIHHAQQTTSTQAIEIFNNGRRFFPHNSFTVQALFSKSAFIIPIAQQVNKFGPRTDLIPLDYFLEGPPYFIEVRIYPTLLTINEYDLIFLTNNALKSFPVRKAELIYKMRKLCEARYGTRSIAAIGGRFRL